MQPVIGEFWELKRVLALPLGSSRFRHLENEWQIHIYRRCGKAEFIARLFRGEFFDLVPTNQLPVPEAPYRTTEFVFVEEIGLFEGMRARTAREAASKAVKIFQAKFNAVRDKSGAAEGRTRKPVRPN